MNLEQKTIISIEVAEMVSKDHNKLLRDIRSYVAQLGQSKIGHTDFFQASSYTSEQNKILPCYSVTKKGCEFIAHKMIGTKGTEFTAKYINRFHEMEEQLIFKPLSKKEELKLYLETLEEQDAKIEAVNEDLQQFKKGMPLLGLECDRITTAVRTKGVNCLGGKESEAYQDKSLRGRVYSDIYGQLKREFAVSTYKALKRSQTDTALSIINSYRLPLALQEEVDYSNSQISFKE